jgi:hypothetical protein
MDFLFGNKKQAGSHVCRLGKDLQHWEMTKVSSFNI